MSEGWCVVGETAAVGGGGGGGGGGGRRGVGILDGEGRGAQPKSERDEPRRFF